MAAIASASAGVAGRTWNIAGSVVAVRFLRVQERPRHVEGSGRHEYTTAAGTWEHNTRSSGTAEGMRRFLDRRPMDESNPRAEERSGWSADRRRPDEPTG